MRPVESMSIVAISLLGRGIEVFVGLEAQS
jgi:hypothetical protein